MGSLTTFSLAFSTPVPRLPSSSTQGLRFDRARVLLLSRFCLRARHGLEVYGAACLLLLFRGSYPVTKSSTNCRSDHARAGPSAGAGPAPVGRPATPAPPRLQTQAHTPRYRSHESPATAPALTVTLQSPSATAKLPDQPSNPPQATAPSFSLVGPASLSRSNRRGLAVVRWKGVNLNGAWRVRKLVAVEPSSGCHTRAPESNRSESLLEAPLRRAVLEAVQVDRTESFFSSGAEWRRVRYGPQ